ncbi:MAG: OadG family protein [Proteobacteria bacterium]|nr:OadG family protein [Pseudomonadota bacterium]
MIIEGLKLMIIGMATVLLFLSLMVILINLTSRATRKITARELELVEFEKKERAEKAARKREALQKEAASLGHERSPIMAEEQPPVAVLAAAIASFEMDKTQG